MQIYLIRNNQTTGPFSLEELKGLASHDMISRTELGWYEGCSDWLPLGGIPGLFTEPPPPPAPSFAPPPPILPPPYREADGDVLVRRIADYEKLSGILWIVLAVIQICTLVAAIAGIWNIFAGISRIQASKQIIARSPNVPKAYEGIAQLVIIGVINLLLGGFIGLLFVGFDFYIRDLVLRNRHLFAASNEIPSN